MQLQPEDTNNEIQVRFTMQPQYDMNMFPRKHQCNMLLR